MMAGMRDLFTVRLSNGEQQQTTGMMLPVPGLAAVKMMCDCGNETVVVMHLRSGTAVVQTHNMEGLARPEVLDLLRSIDWTVPHTELSGDEATVPIMLKIADLLGDGLIPITSRQHYGEITE